jgi:hypothetical protein
LKILDFTSPRSGHRGRTCRRQFAFATILHSDFLHIILSPCFSPTVLSVSFSCIADEARAAHRAEARSRFFKREPGFLRMFLSRRSRRPRYAPAKYTKDDGGKAVVKDEISPERDAGQ